MHRNDQHDRADRERHKQIPPDQIVIIEPIPPGMDFRQIVAGVSALVPPIMFTSCEVRGRAFLNFHNPNDAAIAARALQGQAPWRRPLTATIKAASAPALEQRDGAAPAPVPDRYHGHRGAAGESATPAAAPMAAPAPRRRQEGDSRDASRSSTPQHAPPPDDHTVVISPVPSDVDAAAVRSGVVPELRASGPRLQSNSAARGDRAFLNFASAADAAAAVELLQGKAPWGQPLAASLKSARARPPPAAAPVAMAEAPTGPGAGPRRRCPLDNCTVLDCNLLHRDRRPPPCAAGAACPAVACNNLHPACEAEQLVRQTLAVHHSASVAVLRAREAHVVRVQAARRDLKRALSAPLLPNEDMQRREVLRAATHERVRALEMQLASFDSVVASLWTQQVLPPRPRMSADELRLRVNRECYRLQTNLLPALAVRTLIEGAVLSHPCCVITGATGSGKSTQVVQYLAELPQLQRGRIVCTQPRNIAAESLAQRVAEEWACGRQEAVQVGGAVGFSTEARSLTSRRTRIEFVTEAVLLARLRAATGKRPAALEGVSVVVLDEAHERSLELDVLIGVLRAGQCDGRWPQLRVVVTSATINTDLFAAYLGSGATTPVLHIPGRLYPIEVVYRPPADADAALAESDRYVNDAVALALDIHHNTRVDSGDVLVFLPGRDEVEWVRT